MIKVDESVSPPEFALPGEHPAARKATSMGDVNVSLALRCPICQDPYCEPKQLNCGHSFCLTCLEGSQHLYSINCPICRKATCFNVPGLNGLRLLPNNYALAQVVEAVVLVHGDALDTDDRGDAATGGLDKSGKASTGGGDEVECPQCRRRVEPSKLWFCGDCGDGEKVCQSCVVERHRGTHRCLRVSDVDERWRVCTSRLDTMKTRLTPIRTALRQIACNMKSMGFKQASELEQRSEYLARTNVAIEELLDKAETTRCRESDCRRLIEFEQMLRKLDTYASTYGAGLTTLKETVDEAQNSLDKIVDDVNRLEKRTLESLEVAAASDGPNRIAAANARSVVVVWKGKSQAASSVSLAGSFTQWKPNVHLAQYKGEFLTTLQLPKGRHQFKFLVDEQEWNQSDDYESCDDGHGGRNNFVDVC